MKRNTIIKFISLLGLTSCLLTACTAEKADSQTQEDIVSPKAELPLVHQQIIDLIISGEEAVKTKNGTQLMASAKGLKALGAAPISTTEDLAKKWTVAAQSMPGGHAGQDIPYRGRVKGPAYRTQTLAPGQKDHIEDIYYAAESVEMSLSVLDSASLTWEIIEHDSEKTPICKGQADVKPQTCQFTPLWTTKYRVHISNISDQDTTYLFITN